MIINSKNKRNKSLIILLCLFITTIIVIIAFLFFNKNISKSQKPFDNSIYYNQFVKTKIKTNLYVKENDKFIVKDKIGKDIELELIEPISKEEKYFNIKKFNNEYYIKYSDINKIENLNTYDERYKKYIVFNNNAKTKDKTIFFDNDNNLVYQINQGMFLPIIIKENDRVGVEFDNRLLYLKKDDIEIIENHNTDLKNTKGIKVLNYHFFWDDETEKREDCDQDICHSKSQFKRHLDYLKDNHFFTPTMKEIEMYIDGQIQLPKSVAITIDDGWRAQLGVKMLNEYKMNGTLFLITSYYNPNDFKNEYVELHSHTHNMHEGGKCPGLQGGGLRCLPEDQILNDLRTSREILNDSTILCYPFYEYNDYTIKLAKEAGFTMAFAGEKNHSDNLVKVGANKFKLPRFVIVTYTSKSDFINYVEQ